MMMNVSYETAVLLQASIVITLNVLSERIGDMLVYDQDEEVSKYRDIQKWLSRVTDDPVDQ